MFGRSKTQLMVAVFVFIAALASISYLFLIARYQQDIPFLRSNTKANWIVYYLYPDTVARGSNFVDITTDFTKDFNLPSVPPKAELHIRAFKKYRLWINDNEFLPNPAAGTNWKKMDTLDISPLLVKGSNAIKVQVTCDYGPPALWLCAGGLQEDIRTDTTWKTSISGSPYFPAGLAKDCFVHPAGLDAPRPFRSFTGKFPILVLFFCVSCLVFYFYNYMQKKPELAEYTAAHFFELTPRFVLIVSTIIWTVVFLHNTPKISPNLGFDVAGHLEYIRHIVTYHTLPAANQGWETHQPPLFYVLSAVVLWFASLISGAEMANMALKLIPFLCGVGQIFITYLASRYVFPDSKNKQAISTAFAALIPMNIYISHYVSNESLGALIIGMLILVTIIMLSRGISTKLFCILGAVAGLALLTKVTVFIVLPVVALILLYKLISEERWSLANTAGYFVLTAGIAISLGGWFYFRNWINFGKIFIVNWGNLEGLHWWQDPGFHTYKYFCRFGEVFSAPYFSSFYSFFDSMYASFWGDSMLGGQPEYGHGPPWNYEYVSAVYILALPATMIIIIGAVRAIRAAISRVDKVWLFILGVLFVAIWIIAYVNLRTPYYGVSKAFYSLFVVMPIALTFAFGFGGLDEWLKNKGVLLARTVLYGWFGTLALAIFFSFFVSPVQKDQALDLSVLAREGKLNEAVVYYTKILNNNPNSYYANIELASSYILQNKNYDAIEHYKKALQIRPDWPRTLNFLSMLLIYRTNATILGKKQAVKYAERCCQLTGYLWGEALVTLTDAYMADNKTSLAVKTAEKAMEAATATGRKDSAKQIRNWLNSDKTARPYIRKQL